MAARPTTRRTPRRRQYGAENDQRGDYGDQPVVGEPSGQRGVRLARRGPSSARPRRRRRLRLGRARRRPRRARRRQRGLRPRLRRGRDRTLGRRRRGPSQAAVAAEPRSVVECLSAVRAVCHSAPSPQTLARRIVTIGFWGDSHRGIWNELRNLRCPGGAERPLLRVMRCGSDRGQTATASPPVSGSTSRRCESVRVLRSSVRLLLVALPDLPSARTGLLELQGRAGGAGSPEAAVGA